MRSTYTQKNWHVSFASEYVLHIEIDRPEKLNAFNDALWQSMQKIFEAASTDPDVRVCVLSARGRAFTAGLDITQTSLASTMEGFDPARAAQAFRRHIVEFQAAISSIHRCAKPVICCLHGISYGLAIDIASAADIRYAAKDSVMCVKEVDIGLAADIGSLQRLPYAVGNSSWLREMALTAAPFSASTALQQGLISKICESRDECIKAGIQTATLMAAKSPVAVQTTKFLLDYSREHTVDEGLLMTAVMNSSMLQANDVTDAIAAVVQKKKPVFSKL